MPKTNHNQVKLVQIRDSRSVVGEYRVPEQRSGKQGFYTFGSRRPQKSKINFGETHTVAIYRVRQKF